MALITDLPSNASPSKSDYMITDNGSTTSKSTINNVKAAMGIPTPVAINFVNVPANSSKTITLANETRGLMFAVAPSGYLRGAYIIASTSTGAGTLPTAILAASGLTITSATGQFTVANSQTTVANLYFLIFNGSVSST